MLELSDAVELAASEPRADSASEVSSPGACWWLGPTIRGPLKLALAPAKGTLPQSRCSAPSCFRTYILKLGPVLGSLEHLRLGIVVGVGRRRPGGGGGGGGGSCVGGG